MNILADDSDFEDGAPEPRQNPDLLGQNGAEQVLAEDFASGRLAHAWMLTGPKGIGKATLAYRFARHVLANGSAEETGPSLFDDDLPSEPAGVGTNALYLAPRNPVFQRVAAGGHADLITVKRGLNSAGKPRSEIVVGDVREVGRFMALTAGEGGWRVVVVDSADEMNVNAANALLKVLEEPPPNALLLLVCHNSGRLLPTIRSRCRKLRLDSLEEATIATLLTRYMPELDAETNRELAALSDGSIGRALDLAETDGAELQIRITSLLSQMPSPDFGQLQDFGAQLAKADAVIHFETVADLLRRLLSRLIRHASGSDIGLKPDEAELFSRLTASAGLDRWLQVWEKTDDLLSRTNRINLDRKHVILNVFLNISEAARGG